MVSSFSVDCSEDGDGHDASVKANLQTQFGGYRYEDLGFTLV